MEVDEDEEDLDYPEEEQYGEDVDDDCYEEPTPTAVEEAFEILSPQLLEERQAQEVKKIQEVLDVDADSAAVLLRFFHWNVEALVNKCFEAGPQEVFRVAGIIVDADRPTGAAPAAAHFPCPCCLEEVPYGDTLALNCTHRFCVDCWRQHVTIKVNEGEGRHLSCMQRGCNVILTRGPVQKLIGTTTLQKYQQQVLNSYVEDNQKVKWCPSVPHCGNAVYAAQSSPKVVVQVRCQCGHEFCFNCTQEPHGPASCSMVKSWLIKLEADGGNTSWLSQNTKDCPICGQPVEKNGGCNLMVCRCGASFCWICGMKTGTEHTWTEIKGHTCGKYKDNFDTDHAKTQIQRFQHYHDRFNANAESAKLEHRLFETLDARIETLQRLGDGTLASWDWLVGGIQTLRTCRQILRWTYTWAYYAFGAPGPGNPYSLRLPTQARLSAKNIFEDSQEQLEYLTERLSKELETPVTVMAVGDLAQLRSIVLRMTRAANNRCRGIFDVLEKNLPKEDYVEFR